MDVLEKKFNYEKYKKLAENPKTIAIGEIGLDYKYPTDKNLQKDILEEQLLLAKELNLPVILHCRQAHNDLMEILSQASFSEMKGVIHCFSGNWQEKEGFLSTYSQPLYPPQLWGPQWYPKPQPIL